MTKFISSKNQTLLETLIDQFPDCSNSTLRSWLKKERIFVDGHPEKVAKSEILKDQQIELVAAKKTDSSPISILFQDNHLVVVEKPTGLLSVKAAFEKDKTVHTYLKEKFKPKKIYVVHRLDQDTSGNMIFALSEQGYTGLKEQFKDHSITRRYTAIVEGQLEEDSGTWKSYLIEDANYVVHSTKDQKKGELAITHFKVIKRSKQFTWLELELETGKKNQIRVQCQDAGHSVVGDIKYGAKKNPIKRLCLHAHHLSFIHPVKNRALKFESKVPESFFKLALWHKNNKFV